MGSNLATELASGTLGLDMESAIAMHLRGNHYPPVPYSMVEPCIKAIENYNEGFHNEPVELPEGVKWRGDTIAPSWAIIESHHLDAWCESEEDYE
ncbi:MAG: hypothetical protein WCG95_08310 [bacterium]